MLELREYQKDIVKKTIATDKSTLIQIPTGGGKTLMAKEIIAILIREFKKQVLFVAPKIILMEQTAKTFSSLNPQIMHGLENYSKHHHLLISTIQTASRRELTPDVIIIDEIHHGFNGVMIEKLIKDKPNVRVIGLSATPYGKNGKLLTGFELILDQYDLKYMIQNLYLVKLQAYQLVHIRNLDKVKVTAGDYNLKDLSKVVSNNQTILEIVDSSLFYIGKYKKTIVFAVDINHAEVLAKAYQHEGVSAVALHSKMTRDAKSREISRFINGETKVLVSVLMLTTGFDVPDTDLAIIARPTKSQNLYKQMVGRILRIAPNKTHAVLLDCGNVIENLGEPLEPIKETEVKQTNNKHTCPICHSENLKLKKEEAHSYWICQECHNMQEIEHGAYECKICRRKYASNAQFSIKDNKLFLVCKICPYPTLISEFSGDEVFVEVGAKKEIRNRYLSFEEARQVIHQMGFKSKKDWQRFIQNTDELSTKLPSTIPTNPHIIYQNSGWINISDWLGLDKNEIIDNSQYLPFEEARNFVVSLNLNSHNEWKQYCNGEFTNLPSMPMNIPLKPYIAYKDIGWKSMRNWLGLDNDDLYLLIQQLTIAITNQNFDLINILLQSKESRQNQIANIVLNRKKEFLQTILNSINTIDTLAWLMNCAISNNNVKGTKLILNLEISHHHNIVNYVTDQTIITLIEHLSSSSDYEVIKTLINKDGNHILSLLIEALRKDNYTVQNMIIKKEIKLEDIFFNLDISFGYLECSYSYKVFKDFVQRNPNLWKTFDITSLVFFIEQIEQEEISDMIEFFEFLLKNGINIILNENELSFNEIKIFKFFFNHLEHEKDNKGQ